MLLVVFIFKVFILIVCYCSGVLSRTLVLYNCMILYFQTDDIKTKMRDLIQPGADTVKEQMGPFRTWVRIVYLCQYHVLHKSLFIY